MTNPTTPHGTMTKPDYDAIFRRLHPSPAPYSPHFRPLELRDLWPVDQEKFKREVDAMFIEWSKT